MSTETNEFFNELKEWSERKLKVLEGYLKPFVQIVGKWKDSEYVCYVDGFAGAGVYTNGDKGSALRAVEFAQKCLEEKKVYQLRCINIEADDKNFKNLSLHTQKFGNLATNLEGTFVDNVSHILQLISHRPALCFLDPFGLKGIDLQAIEKIVSRPEPTDLWIRFDHSTARRLDGFFGLTEPSAKGNLDILCRTYGIQNVESLHRQLVGESTSERIKNAVNLYTRQLREIIKKEKETAFVGAYSIKSITGQDKYHLVFASSHPRGAILASEHICSIEEDYQRRVEDYKGHHVRQPLLLGLFTEPSEEDIFNDKVSRLKESIWDACHGQVLSRTDIYALIWQDWFGRIKSRHMNSALRSLVDGGMITNNPRRISGNYTKFHFRRK